MEKIFRAVSISLLFALLSGCTTMLPLHSAAESGDTATISKLLSEGADVNQITPSSLGPAIIYASRYCHTDAVKLLLEKGANINAAGSMGITAMHTAAAGGCDNLITHLIDKGAAIDPISGAGYTPLSLAAYWDKQSSVRLLIEKGADPDVAISGLTRNKRSDKAHMIQQMAKIAQKDKAQVAIKQGSRPSIPVSRTKENVALKPSEVVLPISKSDVDELPSMKKQTNRNAYAIVIGIEQYRQKLPKADFAAADAKVMSEYLTEVMGYPEENVVTLMNDRALKSDFEKYFDRWLSNNVETNGTVFIYYSGHGAPNPRTGDAYLVPYDGDPTFIAETGYSLSRLYESLGKLKAKDITVVLDSCFSGGGGRSVLAKGAKPLVVTINTPSIKHNIAVMTASTGDQISSAYEEKGHGLFTYFLLKGLKNEGVLKSDGSIQMDDLFGYIKPQVERIARKQFNNEQTPQLIGVKSK